MSREFLDRLARGELTNVDQYERMKNALQEIKTEGSAKASASPEWQEWGLSPEWSASDTDEKTVDDGIRADSVQHALDRLDKL